MKICLRNHKTCWGTIDKQTDRQTGCVLGCREQERISKAEAARRETERILREQQAEVDAKKADMVKRDIQREKVSLRHYDTTLFNTHRSGVNYTQNIRNRSSYKMKNHMELLSSTNVMKSHISNNIL